jgi:hypothetical protein
MKQLKIAIITTLLLSSIYGWYPDYTVLATDFKLRNDFLLPTQMNSINLVGLGAHFKNFYSHPLDNVFLNPAYLNFGPKNYLYFDLAGEEFYGNNIMEYPSYGYDEIVASDSKSISIPDYWSPYREVENNVPREPIFRVVYLGQPFGKLPLGIGFTAEYFYDQEKFYQPYWYSWGLKGANATDVSYEEGMQDPYDDYRIVEAGANDETTDGFRVSGMLSYPILPQLTIGTRLTIHIEDVDGTYRNLDDQDDNYGESLYKYYNDSERNRTQKFSQNDISFGAIWDCDEKSQLGINIGRVSGDINRKYSISDTSFYHSMYHYTPLDSNYYTSWSNLENDKDWIYNGNSFYGTVHGDVELDKGMLLRFSIFKESTNANLYENEMLRNVNVYESSWWDSYDSTRRSSYDNSWVNMIRYGYGEFTRNNLRLTVGIDWELSSMLRFIGGISFDHLNIEQNATEPLTGTKYSLRELDGYDWIDYNILEITQEDGKEFAWEQSRKVSTLAMPIGAVISPSKYFEFQIGLTKVMQRINIDESYDVIVYKDKRTEVRDGVTTIVEEKEYVDGHKLPVIKTFINEFEFNFSATIKKDDKFGVTAVLTESLFDPRSLKLGAFVSW